MKMKMKMMQDDMMKGSRDGILTDFPNGFEEINKNRQAKLSVATVPQLPAFRPIIKPSRLHLARHFLS
ncbi:hypothetical protein TWF132_003258 [Orbilia oligospora]|nr:hypothetical protein TWF132_003258 [Orbilia oligospora]